MNMTPVQGPAGIAAGGRQAGEAHILGSAEVLQQFTSTLSLFRRFMDAERQYLNPWEEGSLSVAEQSLERAALAFSQLHADLHHPLRRWPKPDAPARSDQIA